MTIRKWVAFLAWKASIKNTYNCSNLYNYVPNFIGKSNLWALIGKNNWCIECKEKAACKIYGIVKVVNKFNYVAQRFIVHIFIYLLFIVHCVFL